MANTAAVTGADDNERNDMFMWESSSHLTLHRMRDFVMQTMTQPKMQVLIPKRSVTVPHTRSKRIQQLQARPRDPNASPFLLMIAPPTDCRYRLMNRGEQTRHQQNTFNGERLRTAPSVTQLSRRQQTPQSVGPMSSAWQESMNCVPGPEYLHQISTIAAMAWSDCSQATEKLRRIYEQTALLSQNPISVMNSCGQTPMTPSTMAHEFAGKLNGGFPHLQQQELLKYDASAMKPLYDDRPWEMPAVYCACAVCQMTKRAKSSMNTQRSKGGDISKPPQPQHHIKQQHLVDQQAIAAGLAGQTVRRHKRTLSPNETSYQSQQQQQPPRKMPKHDSQAVAKQRSQASTGQTFLNHSVKGVNGSLLPYMSSRQPPPFPDEAAYLAQNLFMSGLQNPGTSSYLTSSGDMVTPRELMVTPSFENQFFTAPQNGGGTSLGGGILNGFSSFLPPRILNALE
uniref:Uncharacterized protein LOC100185293 n=1 Tax=Phallusia mammillata TaxID=59560 RepID=A0A6F9DIG0_9ASCI|nr:uncharacterized protein LOC100185293 [Phallusia mammillata]